MDDNYNEYDNYDNDEYNEGLIGKAARKKKEELKRKVILKVLAILGPIGILIILIFIPVLILIAILVGGDAADDILGYDGPYSTVSNDSYWWPVGSQETTIEDGKLFASGAPSSTYITSNFGYRRLEGKLDYHEGIDISGYGVIDSINIIAAKDGIVYKVNNTCSNYGSASCAAGAGNLVVLKHSDNNYTVYYHLTLDSITVSVGESVKQGQVIAKMGTSGHSTGVHLHFQIDVGGYGNNFAVDPLTYLSTSDYRPTSQTESGDLLKMLHSWEGTGPMEGDYYKVYDDGYGNLTVGHGVTLKNHYDKFSKRGINTSSLSAGSKIAKSIVDDIESEILEGMKNSVLNLLSSNNINLLDTQVDALVIRMYNTGNISNFPSNYKQYGNTQALYDNYMKYPVKSGGKYSSGLARRRAAEWNLFHNGIYELN